MAELFPDDFLKQLESLHLLARQISRGRQRADRRSLRKGEGLEFADMRPFTAGDDVRKIDWGLFARSRHLSLRLYEEEEDLHVYVLLDTSASMEWGTPSKFDQARRLTAGLAYLALANLDRAGVVPLGAQPVKPWAVGRGRGRFLQLLQYLKACAPEAGVFEMENGMRRWLATRPRRGLVLWVTDLFGSSPTDAFGALDRLRYARQEIGVIQIRHPDEMNVAETGEFELEEVETGDLRKMLIDRPMADAYRQRVEAYDAEMSGYCRRHGIALMQAEATQPATEILRGWLQRGGVVQ